ncbi:hypothetical protein Y032_0375g241 [Ancylostoma ceylanicum]|nr:hypothetical protein Y032_0375g241 [Ancylostoma ceylanicum]
MNTIFVFSTSNNPPPYKNSGPLMWNNAQTRRGFDLGVWSVMTVCVRAASVMHASRPILHRAVACLTQASVEYKFSLSLIFIHKSRFISSLPETDHHLVSVDVQRVNAGLPGSPDLLTVSTAGNVTLGGTMHGFTHTFILMVEDGKYKVNFTMLIFV